MIRLRTDLYIAALRQRATQAGAFVTIARKGDEDAGIIAVKIYGRGGRASALIETRDEDYAMAWRRLTDDMVAEKDVDSALAREASFDPDLWVVEIEDPEGRHFLTEPVI